VTSGEAEDRRMRVFETAHDQLVLPGIFMVARIDGRNFTRLTKELHPFDAPFDERFRDLMVAAMRRVMDCGVRVSFGFSQSDEISVLIHRDDDMFQRKTRKLDSILASEATGAFVLGLGEHAAFDCRISQLPSEDLVRDYFRWRQNDAAKNALNAHAYWFLRNEGMDGAGAEDRLRGMSASDKNELLFSRGINFSEIPAWQRRGVGMWWIDVERPPKSEHPLAKNAIRRELHLEDELPRGEAFDELLRHRIREATTP
jgi:tRNA(His) guanylyltransferase